MRTLDLDVEPSVTALRPMRRSLDTWLEQIGIGEKPRAALVLAAHEAVVNAIQHAGLTEPVHVRACDGGEDIVVSITDNGHWKTPDEEPLSCGGLAMIERLVSAVAVTTRDRGTTVLLRQRLA